MHSSGEQPQQFWNAKGEIFLAGAERTTGPTDASMPRRCVGTGPTRAAASRALVRALTTYDSTYRIVFPQQTRAKTGE